MMPNLPGEGGRPLSETALGPVLSACAAALRDEVAAASEQRHSSLEVAAGRLLHAADGAFLYAFRFEGGLAVPPETPVRLAPPGGEAVNGIVVAVHDFEIVIEAVRDLGASVERCRLSLEPWFIADRLRQKLQDAQSDATSAPAIALAVAGRAPPEQGRDEEVARGTGEALSGVAGLAPNRAQTEAIARCAGSTLHFVWGPPGTGKTSSVAQVVRALASRGERVLVLAHANAAVDVSMLRVADALAGLDLVGAGRVLRAGHPQLPEARARRDILPERVLERRLPQLCGELRELERRRDAVTMRLGGEPTATDRAALAGELQSIRERLAAIREICRQETNALLAEAAVLGATLSRFVIDETLWTWPADAIVVDEVSMAPFPAVLAAALRARKRLLLFGDLRQLPPIHLATTRDAREWLGRDAFDIAGVRDRLDGDDGGAPVTLLDTQYRMATPIAELVSAFAYEGRLKTADGVDARAQRASAVSPWPGEALVLIDTRDLGPCCLREPRRGSFSRAAPLHALLALGLVGQAVRAGQCGCGIVTPYRAQARLAMAGIEGLGLDKVATAATVHRFQGSERDVILLDLVDAAPETGASALTGKDADTALRLLNVAASRARARLIVIADVEFVRRRHPRASPARALVDGVAAAGRVVRPGASELRALAAIDGLEWHDGWSAAAPLLAREIAARAKRAWLNLPEGFPLAGELLEALASLAKTPGSLVVFGPVEICEALESTQAELRLRNLPGGMFAIIDESSAWCGGRSDTGPIARVSTRALVQALSDLLLIPHLALPAPDAAMERRLDEICGRCADCGEQRRPRWKEGGGWSLRCAEASHRSARLQATTMRELAQAMGLCCPECGGAAVVRGREPELFFGCVNYAGGCRGRPPRLDQLFGGG